MEKLTEKIRLLTPDNMVDKILGKEDGWILSTAITSKRDKN